jgi:hypothetical protein
MRTFLKSGSSRVVARCAAICLLVLTALPFTAPFATCELSDTALVMLDEDGSGDAHAKYGPAVSLPSEIFDFAPLLLLAVHSRAPESFCISESCRSLATPLRL